jgi:hypothetical protein
VISSCWLSGWHSACHLNKLKFVVRIVKKRKEAWEKVSRGIPSDCSSLCCMEVVASYGRSCWSVLGRGRFLHLLGQDGSQEIEGRQEQREPGHIWGSIKLLVWYW